MLSKRLSNKALESVAARRVLALFFRNRQTEASRGGFVSAAEHRKPFIPAACCFFEHATERLSIQQPAVFAKPVPSAVFQFGCFLSRQSDRDNGSRRLWRELRAAFGAAALENEAACLGRHTGTESVRAGALDFAGLERAFHRRGTWI